MHAPQFRTNLSLGAWQDWGPPVMVGGVTGASDAPAAFFRILRLGD